MFPLHDRPLFWRQFSKKHMVAGAAFGCLARRIFGQIYMPLGNKVVNLRHLKRNAAHLP